MQKKILPLLTLFGGYLLLVLLLFYPLVFQSNTLLAPDSLIPRASTLALDKLQAQTGAYPLWQPWLFSGMPTVEAFSYLSGLYYPNVVFNFFHIDGIVLQLLHLAFAGLGVFFFLRQYGLATLAASFGGAVFILFSLHASLASKIRLNPIYQAVPGLSLNPSLYQLLLWTYIRFQKLLFQVKPRYL